MGDYVRFAIDPHLGKVELYENLENECEELDNDLLVKGALVDNVEDSNLECCNVPGKRNSGREQQAILRVLRPWRRVSKAGWCSVTTIFCDR